MSRPEQQQVVVGPDGAIRFVWSDDLGPELIGLGAAEVRRASNVEPSADGSGWTADLSPVGGPMLGPHGRRGDAVADEVAWLERQLEQMS